MKVEADVAKKKLATLWFGFVFCLLAVLVIRNNTAGDKCEGLTDALWGFFLPAVSPTLALIVGVLVSDAKGRSAPRRTIDEYTARWAWLSSLFYLIVVGVQVFMMTDYVCRFHKPPNTMWVGPLQGIVTALLGVFFVRKESPDS